MAKRNVFLLTKLDWKGNVMEPSLRFRAPSTKTALLPILGELTGFEPLKRDGTPNPAYLPRRPESCAGNAAVEFEWDVFRDFRDTEGKRPIHCAATYMRNDIEPYYYLLENLSTIGRNPKYTSGEYELVGSEDGCVDVDLSAAGQKPAVSWTVQKDMLELAPFTVTIDDAVIVPIKLCYDDRLCSITFMVTNDRHVSRKLVRFGSHDNYMFHIKLFETPFTVNLRTNVIKKERVLSEAPYKNSKFALEWVELRDGEILHVSRELAEANLSASCLALAEEKTETDYWWTLEESGWAVVFELPGLFCLSIGSRFIHDLAYNLDVYAKEYMDRTGLNAGNYEERFRENVARGIKLPDGTILLIPEELKEDESFA